MKDDAVVTPVEIAEIPRSALASLSHRCADLGPDGVRALREAGYRAGVTMFSEWPGVPRDLPLGEFWQTVDAAFREAGLGSVRFKAVSSAIGAVAWTGSVEAMGTRSERPGVRCHLAAGLLGGVLSRTAGKTVDVLEVRCGGGGDRPCWFLIGSVASLRAVHTARQRAGGGDRHPSGRHDATGAAS